MEIVDHEDSFFREESFGERLEEPLAPLRGRQTDRALRWREAYRSLYG